MGDFFKDKHGNLVLWQFPNPPLLVWGLATLIAKLTNDTVHDVASVIAFGAIFTWAWLELFDGATGFRRLLGLIVLIGAVLSRVPK